MRPPEHRWLLITFLVPLLIGGAGEGITRIRTNQRLQATEVNLNIGQQPFGYAGNREALKAVAAALETYPNAQKIYISRTVDRSTAWQTGPRWIILYTDYDRRTHHLRDSRLGEGSGWWFVGATEVRIRAAVRQNCSFEDLGRFGCQDIAT